MTNPNEKYGFGPKTRDGREVVITMTGPTWKYGTLDGGGYNWDSRGKSVTKFEGADLIPLSELAQGPVPLPGPPQGAVGQEAPAVTDRMELDQPCQSCTGWQRIDKLRCIQCSGWSHQNYEPLDAPNLGLAAEQESKEIAQEPDAGPTLTLLADAANPTDVKGLIARLEKAEAELNGAYRLIYYQKPYYLGRGDYEIYEKARALMEGGKL